MSDYLVRAATEGDVRAIARFNQAMALETEEKQLADEVISAGVARMVGDPELGFYLVSVLRDEVVACLGVTTEWSDWRNGAFWWIQSVYVQPDHRRQGVFRGLYERVRTMALARDDVCGVRLYVEKSNDAAYRTYLRLGMVESDYRMMEEEFDRGIPSGDGP